MLKEIRPAIVMMVCFTILTGLIYPLAMTGIAQVVFPRQANGSLIKKDDKVIGSELIGQNFTEDKYFHGRPSATTDTDPKDPTKTVPAPYNAANSSGSNAGPTAKSLIERVQCDTAKRKAVSLVPHAVRGRSLGLMGEPHVNVMRLNMALDALRSQSHRELRWSNL